jgi:ribonucleoside-diphosphate reductase subunit M2
MIEIENLQASYGPESSPKFIHKIDSKNETLHAEFNIKLYQGLTSKKIEKEMTEMEKAYKNFSLDSALKDDDEDDMGFFPIKRPMLLKYYYEQRENHWLPSDLDMTEDRRDYDMCTTPEKDFINGILAFFIPADGLVVRNIFRRFQKDTSFWKEAVAFYAEQGSMETIHGEVYSLMADVMIRDHDLLKKLQNSISQYSSVGKIASFMKKYMSRDFSLLERILAFACIEGILFTSAFTAVRWIKKRNILLGFCKANEWISRDEGIHFKFAVALFLMICMRPNNEKPSMEKVYNIVEEAVDINKDFINEILKADLIGLSNEDLLDYTKCTADTLLESLEYPKLYNAVNKLDWMSILTLPNKTNFFEGKVAEYSQVENGEFIFDEDADF